jgi:hypothetical protein
LASTAVVEHLGQEERRALGRRQPLEQAQERQRQVVDVGGGRGRDRLGQPRPDVGLAAGPRRAQLIEGEPRHHRHQEAARVAHRRAIGGQPAHPRLLEDVVGVGGAAQHAVGDAEQPRPVGLEARERIVVGHGAAGSARSVDAASAAAPRRA